MVSFCYRQELYYVPQHISKRLINEIENDVWNNEDVLSNGNFLNDDKKNRWGFTDEMFVVDLLNSKKLNCSKIEKTLVLIETDSVSYDFLLIRGSFLLIF